MAYGRLKRMGFCAAALVAAAACTQSDADVPDARAVMTFDTALVYLSAGRDTVRVLAEVARTGEQRTMGLMERTSLADTAGMIFLYETDQDATAGFWMFRTRIPLDIAFADASGRIVAVRTMTPCEAQLAAGCPTYDPGAPYRSALEVNAGFFARHRIGVGARLWLAPRPAAQ